MSISVKCGNCGKTVKARDEHAGKKVKCPGCGAVLKVPAAEPPPNEEAYDEFSELTEDAAEEEPVAPPPRAGKRRGGTKPSASGGNPARTFRYHTWGLAAVLALMSIFVMGYSAMILFLVLKVGPRAGSPQAQLKFGALIPTIMLLAGLLLSLVAFFIFKRRKGAIWTGLVLAVLNLIIGLAVKNVIVIVVVTALVIESILALLSARAVERAGLSLDDG